VRAQQPHQTGGPHPGGQPFPADVAEGEEQSAARLLHGEEVTREIPDGEDFARNLEVAVLYAAGGAQTPMHLRCLEQRRVEIGVILLEHRELQLQLLVRRPARWAPGGRRNSPAAHTRHDRP
jgi:hypothetical protein